jgi:hypothetical protein
MANIPLSAPYIDRDLVSPQSDYALAAPYVDRDLNAPKFSVGEFAVSIVFYDTRVTVAGNRRVTVGGNIRASYKSTTILGAYPKILTAPFIDRDLNAPPRF